MSIHSHLALWLIFLFLPFSGKGQPAEKLIFDIRATYEISFIGDSTKMDLVKKEQAYLLINHEFSMFESVYQNRSDSISHLARRGDNSEGGITPELLFKIIKKETEVWTYDNLLRPKDDMVNQGLKYVEQLEELSWQVTGEMITIGSIDCHVARLEFGNRRWIAYFDPDIPISDGPYKFSGLPGLIVRIQDDRGHWIFDLLGIETGRQAFYGTLAPTAKYTLTDKQSFFNKRRYIESNYMEMQHAIGIRFEDEEMKSIIRNNVEAAFKSRSNWIELY